MYLDLEHFLVATIITMIIMTTTSSIKNPPPAAAIMYIILLSSSDPLSPKHNVHNTINMDLITITVLKQDLISHSLKVET